MLFTDVIRRKRDGAELRDEDIRYFVDGLADSSLPAEQVAALAMAIYLNSMSFEETSKLTIAMVIALVGWSSIPASFNILSESGSG